ncbi:MAG: apolipoprotein N-acyltransferase [Kordiimonadales bacterium]|nr:MAG: apolipoprotein N-acyltransferase [Kordiimonadales bacterium]
MPQNDQNGFLHNGLLGVLAWLEAKGRFGIPAFCFLVGGLLSFAVSPYNFFPVIFISIPLSLALVSTARSSSAAFGRGWWVGFGFFVLSLSWIGHSFTQQDQVPAFLAPFAMAALSGTLALYVAASFWVTRCLKVTGIARVFVFAAAWTLFEVSRGTWFFDGFPWNLVGSLWAEWNYMAQGAYWFSVYGLSFLTVLGAGSLALFFESKIGRQQLISGLVCFLIFPALWVAGYQRVADVETAFHLNVSMRLVQGNIKQIEKWRPHLIDDHFNNHMQLSRGSSSKAKNIKLLIWPEDAVEQVTFDREGSIPRWRISRLLEYGNYAIIGASRFEQKDRRRKYYNSMFALNSKGDIYARYDKNHLVPFGEYTPATSLLEAIGLRQLVGLGSFYEGTKRKPIRLPGVPAFIPLICYESIFPGEVFAPGERPQWILNISNDAWFGLTSGPYQHLALARLRAVEEGLPLVRSTSSGISTVIDGYGRTMTSLGVNRRGTVESPLPRALGKPLVATSTRILAVLFLSAGILLFFLIQCVRQLRARKV